MWNPNSLSATDAISWHSYTLPNEILAMELTPGSNGEARLGPLARIPSGAEIECCGEGFNERTVKVRWGGSCYFVFLRDLESQPKLALACVAG